MTMWKPTLRVNKLSVVKDSHEVLAVQFHSGVNIVSGHNSSGKTTVLDFLAYSLGAENVPFKKQAFLCDSAFAEVSLNGSAVTLRRDVNEKALNPLHIFWGTLDAAKKAPILAWETYPFKRSSTKISFTQSLLLALGLPEAQGDGASNLTMHQFLRVLYADQPSLHSPIFRVDTFDNALTRETVGNYLCGIYDDALYTSQLERRELEKEAAKLTAELRSIYSVFARSEQDIGIEFFEQQINSLEQERAELAVELARTKSERTVQSKETNLQSTEGLRGDLDAAKSKLFKAKDELATLDIEMADTTAFIDELGRRLENIEESSVTRKYFGSLKFEFCPSCLTPLSEGGSAAHYACDLCKSPLAAGHTDGQLLRMKNEIRIQIRESNSIMAEARERAKRIQKELPGLKKQLNVLEQRYRESAEVWSSDLENAIEASARRLGELDQRIKTMYESQKLASVIKDLQARRDIVSARFVELDGLIEKLEFSQEERKRKVSYEVSSKLASLLRKDLDRQAEFKTAEMVEFSFADNEVIINGSRKFSESSTVVLRHLFHVSLLSASTKLPTMRLPRFMILDGIEDGGLEPERAHLLQEIIVDECERFESDYQLIFASSQISPSLNNDRYVVGRVFTEESRSLSIR